MEFDAPSEHTTWISVALSPGTTRQMAAEADRIDLSECKRFADGTTRDNSHFESAEEFVAYALEWIGILQRAAVQGKGVVVTSFA